MFGTASSNAPREGAPGNGEDEARVPSRVPATAAERYREAGVDIEHAGDLLNGIRETIASTFGPRVLGGVGAFAGVFQPPWRDCAYPVLVSSIDGVGTKLRVASMVGRHDTVGEDLVNHCVNDIGVQGADPMFFLDYFGAGRLADDVFPRVLEGLARGCRTNGCALIGGETAEMPGLYHGDDYDLVGCVVGIADRARLITGATIRPGDVLVGVASTGLHTNGYSLARSVLFERLGWSTTTIPDGFGESIGDALLRVHTSYLPLFRMIRDDPGLHGLAHLTGGGWFDNIRRILPDDCRAVVNRGSWPVLPIFRLIQDGGGIDSEEMHRVFNMGIGLVAVATPRFAPEVMARGEAGGFRCWEVGRVECGRGSVELQGGKS